MLGDIKKNRNPMSMHYDPEAPVPCSDCHAEAKESRKVFVSNSTDLLCDIRMKIAVEFNWINPPSSKEEEVARELHEIEVRKEAHSLSASLTKELLKRGA